MTDWMKAAQSQEESYLKDLTTLLEIPSVRDDQAATDEYPLGPMPAKALQEFLKMAKNDGFRTKNIDNLVGYAEWGESDETLAILAHLDVMPAGKGWETDPFKPVIKDGKLYARGASDDKGPGLACYYALKYLKDQGVKFNKKVRFIVGTDEESNWTGMHRYFEVEPAPTLGFSPDAEFPVINGEKGQFSLLLDVPAGDEGTARLKSFQSGLRFNMVPREAVAEITTSDKEKVMSAFGQFIDENPVTGQIEETMDGLKITVIGKAAHGMEPEKGINAGTYLALFLNQYDFAGGAASFIKFLAEYLHLDTRMKKFNSAFTDDVMGELTMNAGILNFTEENGGKINMNFRYPKGITPDEIQEKVKQVTKPLKIMVKQGEGQEPHYVDPEDPIVKTLMKAYTDISGDQGAKPEVVGGGTYGRLMKRGVAFGALMPNTPNTMHQANEFQPVDDLITSMAIYMQAINDLVTD
ncbi:dipeptidase PepV [Limosilactobacillus sp. Sa3CUN2]|uniref:Dipeptidase PepV n=1 Tax=Limosilactobacillus avistercoris TaxID=2762243 RepID=A0ABR8PDR5_9LACO|nr:dipeptidase PepV [Limosilactobacillus avistercoris]MBD7895437.1 dipeptidase PepV [Limosilactobacillus avistercoris]